MTASIEKLREWIKAGDGRGWLLEEGGDIPPKAYNNGSLADAIGRWSSPVDPPVIDSASREWLPDSFVDLLEQYGSVHWSAPLEYYGSLAFSFRNQNPEMFLAIKWPPHLELEWEYADALPDSELRELKAANFIMIQDGFQSTSAAISPLLKNAAGAPLVLQGFDAYTFLEAIRDPTSYSSNLTFDAWLSHRIQTIIDEYTDGSFPTYQNRF